MGGPTRWQRRSRRRPVWNRRLGDRGDLLITVSLRADTRVYSWLSLQVFSGYFGGDFWPLALSDWCAMDAATVERERCTYSISNDTDKAYLAGFIHINKKSFETYC